MEEIKQLREQHKKEIDDFMNSCPHTEISDWMPFMWAPGHFSHNVKVCKRCEKIIENDAGNHSLRPASG